MTRRPALVIAAVLLAFGFQFGSRAGAAGLEGTVWAGLFLGTSDADAPGDPPVGREPAAVVERMRRAPELRFDHYTLLGEHAQPLAKEYDSWVVPARGLFFSLDSRGPAPGGGLHLAVRLWQEKEVLLKTDVVLAGDRHLLIRGPRYGKGHLLLALRLLKR